VVSISATSSSCPAFAGNSLNLRVEVIRNGGRRARALVAKYPSCCFGCYFQSGEFRVVVVLSSTSKTTVSATFMGEEETSHSRHSRSSLHFSFGLTLSGARKDDGID
jgi:hypothetical protein